MDRYPLNLSPGPADFGTWGTTSHVVTKVDPAPAVWVDVTSAAGDHVWMVRTDLEAYVEFSEFDTYFADALSTDFDEMLVALGSPSEPATPIAYQDQSRPGDDPFIDVEFNFTPPPT